jgi:hypothetical protein
VHENTEKNNFFFARHGGAALGRKRQENHEFKASLGYTVSSRQPMLYIKILLERRKGGREEKGRKEGRFIYTTQQKFLPFKYKEKSPKEIYKSLAETSELFF